MWTLSGSSDNRAHSHTESLSLHVAHSFPPQPRESKASAALDSWCLIGTLHWTKCQCDVQGQQWVMGQRKLEGILRKPHVSAPPWGWTCKAIEHGGVATAPGNALERKNPVWCREECTADWAGQVCLHHELLLQSHKKQSHHGWRCTHTAEVCGERNPYVAALLPASRLLSSPGCLHSHIEVLWKR